MQGDGAKEIDVSNVIRERDILQQERDFFRNHYNEISRRMAQAALSTPSVPQSIVSFSLIVNMAEYVQDFNEMNCMINFFKLR